MFKGLGSKIYASDPSDDSEKDSLIDNEQEYFSNEKSQSSNDSSNQNKETHQSTSIEFEVKHLSILLNKSSESTSKFAKFKVDNVLTLIESRYDYMLTSGKLGSLSIFDVSPNRGLYTEKFLTSGKQALDFDFFKHNGPPDYNCKREYDNLFKLRMSSVKYIHIQSFISELTNYFQQFNQLQDALSRMRALSLGQGNISYVPQRSTRVKLDIQTQTPIIVIPIHSTSIDALILNLGKIRVENNFMHSGDEGSLSFIKNKNKKVDPAIKTCLIDIIKVQFTDTNLYSAVRFKTSFNDDNETDEKCDESTTSPLHQSTKSKVEFNNFFFKQQSGNILEKKSYLFLQLEHNLETSLNHSSPDWSIHAKLNSFFILS